MTKELDFYSVMAPEKKQGRNLDFESDQETDEIPDFYSLMSPEASASSEQDDFQDEDLIFEDEAETPDFYFLVKPEDSLFEKTTSYLKDVFTPKAFGTENVYDIYEPKDLTDEEFASMSGAEKQQYGRELARFRELQESKGLTKNIASGLTLSASEYIPGLEPEEEDLMQGIGNAIGSYLPITGIYNILGKPLVQFAAKSPVARQGLMSLARMTGFGVTGVAHKGASDLVQGEVPTAKELAKEGATWFAIDAALQAAGVGIAFHDAVQNISKN